MHFQNFRFPPLLRQTCNRKRGEQSASLERTSCSGFPVIAEIEKPDRPAMLEHACRQVGPYSKHPILSVKFCRSQGQNRNSGTAVIRKLSLICITNPETPADFLDVIGSSSF